MSALAEIASIVAQDVARHAVLAHGAVRAGDADAARVHAARASAGALARGRAGWLVLVADRREGFAGCAHAHERLSDAIAECDTARGRGLRVLIMRHAPFEMVAEIEKNH